MGGFRAALPCSSSRGRRAEGVFPMAARKRAPRQEPATPGYEVGTAWQLIGNGVRANKVDTKPGEEAKDILRLVPGADVVLADELRALADAVSRCFALQAFSSLI